MRSALSPARQFVPDVAKRHEQSRYSLRAFDVTDICKGGRIQASHSNWAVDMSANGGDSDLTVDLLALPLRSAHTSNKQDANAAVEGAVEHMKKQLFASTIVVIVSIFLAGCRRNSTPQANHAQTETRDTGQILKQRTDDVDRRVSAELDDWNRRIDRLKDESKQVKSKAAKDRWKNAIADLERKRDTVKNRLSDLKSAGADTWDKVNGDLDTALAELKNSYNEVITKLGHSVSPPLRPES
jgi:hypothetical protein